MTGEELQAWYDRLVEETKLVDERMAAALEYAQLAQQVKPR
jgi:hypothetical protein